MKEKGLYGGFLKFRYIMFGKYLISLYHKFNFIYHKIRFNIFGELELNLHAFHRSIMVSVNFKVYGD